MDNEQGCPSVSVETQRLRLTVRRDNGEYEIHHIPTCRVWSGPKGRLCSLTLAPNDGRLKSGFDTDRAALRVDRFTSVEAKHRTIRLVYDGYHRIATGKTPMRIEFSLALDAEDDLLFSYRTLVEDPHWSVHSVTILDDALPIADEGDYAVLPVHEGEVVPVGSHFSYLPGDRAISTRTSDVVGTYTGTGSWSMAMFALVKGSSTAVITWDDPSVEAGVSGRNGVGSQMQIIASVVLNRQAKAVRLHFMTDAGYVEVAKYYREIARQRGFLVPFAEKMKRTPWLEKNIGALRFSVAPKWGHSQGAGWVTFIGVGVLMVYDSVSS